LATDFAGPFEAHGSPIYIAPEILTGKMYVRKLTKNILFSLETTIEVMKAQKWIFGVWDALHICYFVVIRHFKGKYVHFYVHSSFKFHFIMIQYNQ
jgi:hypothetical protein